MKMNFWGGVCQNIYIIKWLRNMCTIPYSNAHKKVFFLWFFPYSNIQKCICKWIVQKDCENNSFLILLTFIRLARLLSEEPYCPLKVRLPLFSHPSRCDQNLPPPCFLSIQFNTKTNTHRQTLFSHPSRWIATKTYHHHAFFQFQKY